MPLDAFGQEHPRFGPEARIVSLVPSITELLFELGLGGAVVGRTGFCVHPRDAVRRVRKVGGTKDVDFDAIAELAPSHVIVNIDENTREAFDRLVTFVPGVVVTHPNHPQDNPGLFRLMGELFGREREAETLAAAFDAALADVRETAGKMPPRRVLYLIWRDPWMTVSPDTYIANTLALVNWHCVPADRPERYPALGDTELHAAGADLALLSSEPYPFRDRHLDEVAKLTGARADVRLIDGEMVSWYGSRAIAGLGYLARFARALEASAA